MPPPLGTVWVLSAPIAGLLIPINAADNRVGAPIGVAGADIALTPDLTRAYVAGGEAPVVVPVDLVEGKVGQFIPVDAFPDGIAITPDGTRALVSCGNAESIVVIDLATNSASPVPIEVVGGPAFIKITPDGTRAYVLNESANFVTPIDIANGEFVAGSPIVVSPTGGLADLALSPDGTLLLVATSAGAVTPVDVATGSAGTPVPLVSTSEAPFVTPWGIAFAPDGRAAYVTSETQGMIIPVQIEEVPPLPGPPIPRPRLKLAPGTPIPVAPIGVAPNAVAAQGIAIAPWGVAYIAEVESNMVVALDLATGEKTAIEMPALTGASVLAIAAPAPSTTALGVGFETRPLLGQSVSVVATVSFAGNPRILPEPTPGTVQFFIDGAAGTSVAARQVGSGPTLTAEATILLRPGSQVQVAASYSGNSYLAPSTSATITLP